MTPRASSFFTRSCTAAGESPTSWAICANVARPSAWSTAMMARSVSFSSFTAEGRTIATLRPRRRGRWTMAVLGEAELKAAVAGLDGWHVRDGALEKAYDRGDF